MATVFKKGDVVKVKAVVPQGPVKALRMDEDGNVYCLIEWVDADGSTQERWIDETLLISGD
jgi:uncharacterized protein YodC (DUF2158 family)